VALVENGVLAEFQLERGARGAGLLGNIYQGRVIRVLPGLQAAFVDIGLEKAAFLYVDDLRGGGKEFNRLLGQTVVEDDPDADEGLEDLPTPMAMDLEADLEEPVAPIETLISEGQELMVQVSKEPMGQKGARVTTHIALPGRRLVFMAKIAHLGVSRRIEDEEERQRLRDLLEPLGGPHGLIARTAAEGATEYELQAEANYLTQLWAKIQANFGQHRAPALVHLELDATLKAVRDIFTDQVDRLIVDDAGQFAKVKNFLEAFAPALAPALTLYEGSEPLFSAYDVEADLARALNRKVWLKSGGYLVIDSTEALTVVDVNTGRYVGRHNFEETILKTNLEAVREIAYQLRLRNLGGLVVIDFIDMKKEANRDRVFTALKEATRRDKGKTKILPMSELGLVEMTRKRTRENIDRLLREPCYCCQGQGYLLSRVSVLWQAFREMEIAACDYPGQPLTLSVHPMIRELILDEGRAALEDLEKRLKRAIAIKADESLPLDAHVIEPGRDRDLFGAQGLRS
jgi:ribonuclease G